MVRKYKCDECKDRGYVELFISKQPCRCQTRDGDEKPDWLASYENYEQYVRGTLQPR